MYWSSPFLSAPSCMQISASECVFLGVLASCGCNNKLAQTGWLNATEIYSLTVQKARRPKSRCWQCWFLLEALRPNPFHAFWCFPEIPGLPWIVDKSLQSLTLSSHHLHLSVFLEERLSSDLGPTWVIKGDFISRFLIISVKTLFPTKVIFRSFGWTDLLMRGQCSTNDSGKLT